MTIKLGCIADDFTGATDIASLIKQAGYSVIQTIGLPDPGTDLSEIDAVVVALKSRTVSPRHAVESSVAAYDRLREFGMQQCFFKYCSTFDSTDQGNIGPVADALLDASSADLAIVCPAFPLNGRTVYMGHLFVHQQLLAESPMRDHPLTPMTDSNLVRVLQAQSKNQVGLATLQQVEAGGAVLRQTWQQLIEEGKRLAVADALDDRHLHCIGESAIEHPLVTGGSALGASLVRARIDLCGERTIGDEGRVTIPAGGSVVLAGSCSAATLGQIGHAKQKMPLLKLDIEQIAAGEFDPSSAISWARGYLDAGPVLIYTSEPASERASATGKNAIVISPGELGERIEQAFACLVPLLVAEGVRRFVVAGGETAGAVTSSIGIKNLRIGEEIDPGVPWTVSEDPMPIALALKSGNFGAEDFFTKALRIIE